MGLAIQLAGTLAWVVLSRPLKSGSILPGMVLHFAGDLASSYFALLGGDPALLLVH